MVKVKLLFKIIVIIYLCDFVFTQPEDAFSTETDDIDPTKISASIGSSESSENNKIEVTTAKISTRFNSKSSQNDDDNLDEDEITTLVRNNLNPFARSPSVPPVPSVKAVSTKGTVTPTTVPKKPTKNIKKKVSRGYNYPKPEIPFEVESSTAAATNNKPNTFGGYHYPKPAKPFFYPTKSEESGEVLSAAAIRKPTNKA